MPSVRAYSQVVEQEESVEQPLPEAEEETPEETIEDPEPVEAPVPEAKRNVSPPPLPPSVTPEQEEVHIPWSEEQLCKVFKKFSDSDGREVHIEDLLSLLRYLGARPTDDEVQTLVRQQTVYSSLDWREFIGFIKRYREYDVSQLKEQFENADIDGSGALDVNELHQLLVKSGHSPTREATEEALSMIDADKSGTVCFDEFEELREHLRITHGFLKTEAEELRMLFDQVAMGPEKLLPTEQLLRICGYIGYNVAPEDLHMVTIQVDKNRSGFITYDELLGVIRGIREHEGERLLQVISGYETSHLGSDVLQPERCKSAPLSSNRGMTDSGIMKTTSSPLSSGHQRNLSKRRCRVTISVPQTLQLANLAPALAQLGYFVSPEITKIILETHLVDREQPHRVTWEELSMFLRAYRRAEGFTQKELDFLRVCFDREQSVSVAGDNDESLDALELGRVLRDFGISRTLQQVRTMIEEIDFDGSGQLEFVEFTKLMRQLFHEEAKQRRKTFANFVTIETGCISFTCIEEAMTLINGVQPDEKMVARALESSLVSSCVEELTITQFEQFCRAYRNLLMESVAVHAGFIPSEVEMLRGVFAKYDLDGTGNLLPTELRALVRDLIPEASESTEGRQEVVKMLDSLSQDPSELDFNGFLWLMRKIQDQRNERDILKEAEVVQFCGYTPEEVEGLRQVFSSNLNWAGEITFGSLLSLFKRIIIVGEQDEDDLRDFVLNVCQLPKHRISLRFPSFMLLMKQVTQENLFGLNEEAERIVRRNELRSKRNSTKISVDKRRRGGVVQDLQPSHLQEDLLALPEEGAESA